MKRREDLLFRWLIAVLITAILALGGYLIYHYVYLPYRIRSDQARWASLYPAAAETWEPAGTPLLPKAPGTAAPSGAETDLPPALPAETAVPSEPVRTPVSTPVVTAAPVPTPKPTPDPTPTEAPPTLLPEQAIPEPDPTVTPDPDTLILSAATLPPVQASFRKLCSLNPETVGYLQVGDAISLPVAQHLSDNSWYLEHDFEGRSSNAGCLFLDSANRIWPKDEVLYIYGHNMKNGTMFGHLPRTQFKKYLVAYSPVRFDTIYEDGVYVPFACFAFHGDQEDSKYYEIRSFSYTQESFEAFVTELKQRSLFRIGLDVQYGDRLLILITCNYNVEGGRFVLALRELRPGESADEVRAILQKAESTK